MLKMCDVCKSNILKTKSYTKCTTLPLLNPSSIATFQKRNAYILGQYGDFRPNISLKEVCDDGARYWLYTVYSRRC